jgi:hypothetical protein|tara:strand:- start:8168 stop:8365 length:198 start_codon:yes stop_codon:yes gene_type:complete
MVQTVFDVLDKKLVEIQKQQEDFIQSGAAKDFAEYREVCGVIRGLASARREIADLSRNYMEDEDD